MLWTARSHNKGVQPPRAFHVHACVVRSMCCACVPTADDDVVRVRLRLYGLPQNGKFIRCKCLTKSNQLVVIWDSQSNAQCHIATMHRILCSRHSTNCSHTFPMRLYCQRIILCCHRLLSVISFLAFYLRWHKWCQHFHGILAWKSAPRNFSIVLHRAKPSMTDAVIFDTLLRSDSDTERSKWSNMRRETLATCGAAFIEATNRHQGMASFSDWHWFGASAIKPKASGGAKRPTPYSKLNYPKNALSVEREMLAQDARYIRAFKSINTIIRRSTLRLWFSTSRLILQFPSRCHLPYLSVNAPIFVQFSFFLSPMRTSHMQTNRKIDLRFEFLWIFSSHILCEDRTFVCQLQKYQ